MASETSKPKPSHHCFLCLLSISFITILLLFHLLSYPLPNRPRSMLQDSVTFLPLKDLRFARTPTTGRTWFMSSFDDEPGEPGRVQFPSARSGGRVLCLAGSDRFDGSRNGYALAWPDALPVGAVRAPGLTFVSETHYDYANLWHGLAAIVPFVAWHVSNGCGQPDRWVLFHWGELRTEMGPWVRALAEASIGGSVRVERFDSDRPICFDDAVVFRHNEGGMRKERRQMIYDEMRCRGRMHCGIGDGGGKTTTKEFQMTLWFRVGSRSFKDEAAVVEIFDRECKKVDGCRMKLARPNNLTFCDQVKLMSETDLLISPHGAQLTDMLFMDKNSSVMEFLPKGWLELAGVGQNVFRWMADWSGMRHRGQWWDPNGEDCPFDNKEDCFTFYKDGKIGHDSTFFAEWAAQVLKEVRECKLGQALSGSQEELKPAACQCG